MRDKFSAECENFGEFLDGLLTDGFSPAVRAPSGGGDSHRREDAEARGRVRRQPPHHDGYRGWAARAEHAQVSATTLTHSGQYL